MEQPAAEVLMKQPVFLSRFQGEILYGLVLKLGGLNYIKFAKKTQDIHRSSQNKISFPICCCVSKPQRIKGNWTVENRGQILHFLTAVKIGGGVGG